MRFLKTGLELPHVTLLLAPPGEPSVPLLTTVIASPTPYMVVKLDESRQF